MNNSIKSVSILQIQDAISKALFELTNNTYEVTISEMHFEAVAMQLITGKEDFYFSAKASFKPPKSNEPIPF